MRTVRRLFAIIVFVGLLIAGWHFAASNAAPIVVRHPGGEFGEAALWLVLLVAFGSGVGLTTLVALVRGARIRLVSRRYQKLVAGLQSEVHQLRNLPLSDRTEAVDSDSALPAGVERGS